MSWETVALGEVCKVIAGQSPEGKYYNKDGKGLPFYQGKKDFGSVYIKSPSVWTTEVTKEAIKDDILMSVRAPVGPVNISTENICIGRGLAAIRATDKIDNSYLFNFLLSIEKNLIGSSGAVFNSINKSQIENLLVPLPPLATQKKIVAKLDAILAEIDKASAAAEANAKNAEALFQSYLETIFDSNNENWVTATLKDVCEKITDGTHQTPTYFDDGVVFLSSKNVTSGKIDWDKVKYIDAKQHLEMSKRISPKIGDVLLAKNGTTGVAAMVDRNVVFDIYVSLALLRAKEQVLPQFLLYFVNSPVAKKQFNSRLKGVGVPNLHLQEIREVVISFPKSLDEQRKLVKQIERFLDITNLQVVRYKNKKNEIAKLKQSILKQAFSGELIKE